MIKTERIKKAVNRLQGIRQFRPRQGFRITGISLVVCLEIKDGRSYYVYQDGARNPTGINVSLSECEAQVASGHWVEI